MNIRDGLHKRCQSIAFSLRRLLYTHVDVIVHAMNGLRLWYCEGFTLQKLQSAYFTCTAKVLSTGIVDAGWSSISY